MTQGVGLVPYMQTTAAPAGSTGGSAPNVPGASSTTLPLSTVNGGGKTSAGGATASKTGGNPIQTFTGAANVNAYSIVAGGFALLAFLA